MNKWPLEHGILPSATAQLLGTVWSVFGTAGLWFGMRWSAHPRPVAGGQQIDAMAFRCFLVTIAFVRKSLLTLR